MNYLRVQKGDIILNGQLIDNPGRTTIIIDKGKMEAVIHVPIDILNLDSVGDVTIITGP